MKICNILFCTLGLTLVTLSSCKKYLDKLPDDQVNEKQAFERFENVDKLVTDAYTKSRDANSTMAWFYHFSSAAITDEAEGTTVEGSITNSFNTGDWTPNGIPGSRSQYWSELYAGVRKANVILAGVETYHTPDNPIQPGDLERRIGETYFLRAYFHYLILRLYGEAPYVTRPAQTSDVLDYKQESVHSMVSKIVSDAEEARKRLPEDWGGDVNLGRVDQGTCLGLIAMARWVAATPLWNGASAAGYTGSRVFEAEYAYRQDRWEAAKVAAKAVLDAKDQSGKPRYALYTKYSATDFNDSDGRNFNGSTVYNRLFNMFYEAEAFQNEYVWYTPRQKTEGWIGDNYPPTRGGSSRHQPVQEQVDEYEYIAPDGYGYPIYAERAKADGYDDGNPYVSVKRDPRFYRDILYHGAPFRNNSNQAAMTNTAAGADKLNASNATKTGYYLRKFIPAGWNRSGSVLINGPAVWRLPDFMYIYAEAVNETTGPTQEIYDMINVIRARSFMVPMPPAVMADKQLMREYIKRERRVEFFFENKRAFDNKLYVEASNPEELAREQAWRASGTTNTERSQNYWAQGARPFPKTQRMINGMRPVEDPNGKIVIDGVRYRMERFFIEDRVFENKHYLFPILNGELQRATGLRQNPGW